MEGPIDFDVWCRVKKDLKSDVVDWLINMHGFSKLDATKMALQIIGNNEYMQVYTECGWDDIPSLTEALPSFAVDCSVTESTYSPNVNLNYCVEHKLYYTSNQGCPVCNGVYIRAVKNGMKIAN